jgi:hypothetical protein
MSQVFGKDDMKEKQIMRHTIYVFSISACVRMLDLIICHLKYEKIAELYSSPGDFNLLLITIWIVTDLMPIVFLYKVHFLNFMSFEGHEVVETEFFETTTN